MLGCPTRVTEVFIAGTEPKDVLRAAQPGRGGRKADCLDQARSPHVS